MIQLDKALVTIHRGYRKNNNTSTRTFCGRLSAFFLLLAPACLYAQTEEGAIDSIRTAVIDTVLITKKIVEFEANKFTFNVSQSPQAKGKTLEDMLRLTPGLNVGSGGNVSLFGMRTAQIHVNGKPVQQGDVAGFLRSIPAESISKIEVVPNPPLNQGTSGEPLVRIYLKKRENEGFNANISGALDMRRALSERASLFSNIRTGKLSLTPMLSVEEERRRTSLDFHSKIGGIEERSISRNSEDKRSKSFNLYGDYPFSDRHNISAVFSALQRDDNNSATGSGSDTLAFRSVRNGSGSPLRLHGGLRYDGKFDSSASLKVDAYIIDADNKTSDLLQANDILAFRSAATSAANNASLRVDFTKSIRGFGDLSLGSRFRSNRNAIDNDYYRYGASGADRTIYTERISQYEISADVPIGKSLSLQAGGQLEYSDIGLETDGKSRHRYHDFLPHVVLMRKGEKAQLTLSFSQMMSRPSYAELDPRPQVLSKNTFQRGNPNLSREIWDVYSVNYVLPQSGVMLFGSMGSLSNMVIYNESPVDGNGQTFIVPYNSRERQNTWVAGATVRRGGERWNYSVTNQLVYRANSPATNVENMLSYWVNLDASLRNIFGSGTNLSFFGGFKTADQDTNEKFRSLFYSFFDFSRNFGRGTTLGLKTVDPWGLYREKIRYTYDAGAFRDENGRGDMRSISFYFSQKIGSDKVKSAKKLDVGDSRLGY